MNSKINTLDVREDIRAGRHPFEKIQNALNVLHHGEALRLLVPFEPVPLYAIAASKGLGRGWLKSKQVFVGFCTAGTSVTAVLPAEAAAIALLPGAQASARNATRTATCFKENGKLNSC